MDRVKLAFIAGLVATYVFGAMLLMNNAVHLLPRLGIGRSFASIFGDSGNLVLGWAIFIGLRVFVFSWLFAWSAPRLLFKAYVLKGLLFGAACWLFTMVVVMPLGGHGFFGAEHGPIVAEMALVLNLIYGVILSLTYRWMAGSRGATDAAAA